jgi:hypothetical protein
MNARTRETEKNEMQNDAVIYPAGWTVSGEGEKAVNWDVYKARA